MINDKQLETITIEQEIQIPSELKHLRETILNSKNKLCVIVYPTVQYVGYVDNVIKLIKETMGRIYEMEVKTLPETIKSQESNFKTILQMIKDCVLGIVILDGLRPNVVLEYGMLLGLEKPIIVLKDKNAEIDIKGLFDNSKSKSKKANIKLNIDKHLSDVKDLHWTCYDWKNPNKLKEILENELVKNKEKIASQVAKPMMPSNLNPDELKDFQEKFTKLAEYSIKFIKPNFESVNEINKEINDLVNQSNVKLPATYYFEIGNIY
ncbi:MAG: hypothetical protein LRZ92_02690, partial [Methanosarcinaceae archaeon]|nr:hypothetical protein [Methanosarcinaceae archaeon]